MYYIYYIVTLYVDNDIVITGEWCGAVLNDFNISTDVHKFGLNVMNSRNTRNFKKIEESDRFADRTDKTFFHYKGRGIQYHLGFHHASNFCRFVHMYMQLYICLLCI